MSKKGINRVLRTTSYDIKTYDRICKLAASNRMNFSAYIQALIDKHLIELDNTENFK